VIVRRLNECEEFLAGDHTHLRELLHPDRVPVKIGYSVAHGHLVPGADSKRHRLEFLCFVDPAWKPEDEHIME
jgi:hypothetical protein